MTFDSYIQSATLICRRRRRRRCVQGGATLKGAMSAARCVAFNLLLKFGSVVLREGLESKGLTLELRTDFCTDFQIYILVGLQHDYSCTTETSVPDTYSSPPR